VSKRAGAWKASPMPPPMWPLETPGCRRHRHCLRAAAMAGIYQQRAMRRDSIRWLRAGLGDFAIVGCWWRKKTGHALFLCTSSVTKSIYKSLYSFGNWATYLGISSKQKLVVRRFSRMFPDVPSLPIHVDLTGLIKYCIDKKALERSVTFQGVSATFCRV